jgi:hypothetical protein
MNNHRRSAFMLSLLAFLLSTHLPGEAAASDYRTGFSRWRAIENGFRGWERRGIALASNGALRLEVQNAQPSRDPVAAGAYHGRNFYNGGTFMVGEATSPVLRTPHPFFEAVASWNAETPEGTWLEVQISAQVGTRWTKWYNLGIWARNTESVERHSVSGQADQDGTVAVDTLHLQAKKQPATALRLKLRFFTSGPNVPSVHSIAVATSTRPGRPGKLVTGDRARWDRSLQVPQCSQMVYRDGGEVWCSPTSTSMVLAYWGQSGTCESRVRAAVQGVYDWRYDGHGNWSFNTAYAATPGIEAYVARLTSLSQAEHWIAAGVPLIISFGWKKGTLVGAPISSSNGHLAVLVGFDAQGNPIVNDPAAANDGLVRRTYPRAQLETLWLEHSGGTVYVIHPVGHVVPRL